jgi:hypothetical protein
MSRRRALDAERRRLPHWERKYGGVRIRTQGT